jgi:ketosteroid isomerase-like protein
MKKLLVLFPVIGILVTCHSSIKKNRSPLSSKEEIVQTERSFEKMAADSGLPAAFSHYAADSGLILRRDTLIMGKIAIKKYYMGWSVSEVSLKWSPDFVDVSSSGDLGYTYGHYTISFKDSTGTIIRNRGIFHTVWRKQQDGSWRFVWD